MEMMINLSDSEDRTSSESSSDEVNNGASSETSNGNSGKFRENSMHLTQPQSLPPYPITSRYNEQASNATAADDSMITYVSSANRMGNYSSYTSYGSPTHLVVKPVNSNPMLPQQPRNMMRLPSNPPRSLPQPPRSLPMPPTYRQTPPPATNSLIKTPSTSLLSNRSVYSVNKPVSKANNQQQQVQQNRQLPQPKQNVNRMHYHQPMAVLPQPPSPKKPSGIPNKASVANGPNNKPISPYIVSVNSPPEPISPTDHSPTSNGHSMGSNSSSTASSSSQSSNDGTLSGSIGGPKYTRVPPPRYRPHQPPLAQRRPLSGGHYGGGGQATATHGRMNHSQGHDYNSSHQSTGGNLRQTRYGGKSVSAESVLVNGREAQSRPSQGYKANTGSNTVNNGHSRSSSPSQSSNTSESQQDSQNKPGGIPQGLMRRSSGLRMWNGQMGHQSRSTVASAQNSVTQASNNPVEQASRLRSKQAPHSRSPSPGSSHARARSQPRPTGNHGQHGQMLQKSSQRVHQSNELNYQSRGSSLPGAYQMSYARSQPQQQQQQQQQMLPNGKHHGQQPRSGGRPSSLHNSPGPSRPTSPQIAVHQKRKSSHYPNSMANGSRQQQQQQVSYRDHHGHPSQQHSRHSTTEDSGVRTSLSSLHYSSNNAKRQIQQPQQQQQRQQQFANSRAYSTESKMSVGLPAPGFSSRLPLGTSQRSN